jgi:hypothetical protein
VKPAAQHASAFDRLQLQLEQAEKELSSSDRALADAKQQLQVRGRPEGCLNDSLLLLLLRLLQPASGSQPKAICIKYLWPACSSCLPPLPLQAKEEAGEALQIQLQGLQAQLAAVEEDLQAKDAAWVELQER